MEQKYLITNRKVLTIKITANMKSYELFYDEKSE